MQIPSWPQAGEREAELLREVLESPQWGGFHPLVADFEQSFAAYQSSAFAISAFNGTVTIEAALTVLGIGRGDEVIVPAISFIATATSVLRIGATPVFVDIGEESFNIDPRCIEEAISPQTKAVIAVHFGGAMCDMTALLQICGRHGLILLEDAAHAHGSQWNGAGAGSFGIAGSFSFQNGKVLTAGEGGMLVTSDRDFAEAARSLANCGRIPGRSFYDHPNLGTNFRMTAFQAAVLVAQFERLPQQIATRTAKARLIRESLGDVQAVSWQQELPEVTRNSFYLLVGKVQSEATRNRLCAALAAVGAPCTPFYPHTLYQNEVFQRHGCRIMPCPVAEARVKDGFWIPHRLLLAETSVIETVADLIRTAVR